MLRGEQHPIDTGLPAAVSFEEFYAGEFPHTRRIVYALCGSWSMSDETCQEAFARAFQRWDDVSGMDRPDAWVRRVACNLATSRFRRMQTELGAMARLGTQRRQGAADPLPDDSARFWQLVRRLPRRQAQVVALHYADDLAVADVAAVLEVSEGTVKRQLHAARKRLEKSYRDAVEADG